MPFSAAHATAGSVHLRLLETTDLHVHLAPYDYYADRPNDTLGLARLAEVIDHARAEVVNSVLFDNGDFLQGTPMGDHYAYDRGFREGDLHPVIGAMNALGVDAITLGNHEFNYGLDFLLKALGRAEFPAVSGNLARAQGAGIRADQSLTRPYALLDRMVSDGSGVVHPLRLGVLGLCPPQVMTWEHHHLHGRLQARDMVEAAAAWVPEMREAGADLVIALAHTGIGDVRHADGMEQAALPLSRIPGIDALMLGHSHLLFPTPRNACPDGMDPVAGTLNGVPAVMAGFWGSHLGVIDLFLSRDGGCWQVLGSRTELRALAKHPARRASAARRGPVAAPGVAGAEGRGVPRSAMVRRAVAAAHAQTLRRIRQPIGRTATPLHSYFALVGHSSATALVAEAQRAHIAAALHGTPYAALPIVSAVAPFKAGGRSGPSNYVDIPAGELALRHVADMYFYPNMTVALLLSGAELRQWLERSASIFAQQTADGVLRDLIEPAAAPYIFEILYGLRYSFDLSVPARFELDGPEIDPRRARVRRLDLGGAPLEDDAQVIVCTNSFRASGGGDFAGARPERIVHNDHSVARDVLRRFIRDAGCVAPSAAAPFRFEPLVGARALLSTGPGARDHLGDLSHFRARARGVDARGFLRIEVDLGAPEPAR